MKKIPYYTYYLAQMILYYYLFQIDYLYKLNINYNIAININNILTYLQDTFLHNYLNIFDINDHNDHHLLHDMDCIVRMQ